MRKTSLPFRIALSLAILALLVVVLYSAYWFYVARQLRAGIEPWAAARRAQGYTMRWDKVVVDGFPGRLRLRFTNASFGATRPVPLTVSAPTIVASAEPWKLHHWTFAAPQGGQLGGLVAAAGFTIGRLEGHVALTATTAIDATAHDIAGNGAAQDLAIGDATLRLSLPAAPPTSHTDTALGLGLQLDRLTLPVSLPQPFGNKLAGLAVAGEIKGALPPGPFRQALAAWRNDGGTIELSSVKLDWGTLAVAGSGTLALDEGLQPEGALDTTISGQDSAVDAAVETGALTANNAHILKTVLGILAKPGPDGVKQIKAPITIQNDQLYLGPVTLAKLPPIDWP